MTPLTPEQRRTVDALISAHWTRLEKFLSNKVAPSDRGDLAQQVVLVYAQKYERVTDDHRAYLYQIARFELLKYWEKQRSRGAAPFDSSVHSICDLGGTMSSVINRRNRVRRAIQSLPAEQQMAIDLRYGLEMTLEEVAVALGNVSLSTAKRYLAAAEATLRTMLGDEATLVPSTSREDDDE